MQAIIFRGFFILIIVASIFDTTSAWRRRRRRRCATHSCSWHWGACSATCGGGSQNPIKTANQGACGSCNMPSGSRSCNTGCCAVNCQWRSWGNWGTCSRPCGGGTQSRTRGRSVQTCGGHACGGPATETRSCNKACCPVPCAWAPWGGWGMCTKSCGGGVQTRNRGYSRHASCGGNPCPGSPAETRTCSQNCCPVNCVWGAWSGWNRCSKTCGGGKQSRNRGYLVAASCGGSACLGQFSQERECNAQCCPVNCVWASWGKWGVCSASCAGGTQSRLRGYSTKVSCGGKSCSGKSEEVRSCNDQCCPVNCAWTAWGQWELCSTSCGGGRQVRERGMDPLGKCGGKTCVGSPRNERECNTQCCPVNCVWGDWSDWDGCTKSCGGGSQKSRRSISIPSFCGGIQCRGEKVEVQECNRQCCAVNCQWGMWQEWSRCTKTCEKGVQTRIRETAVSAFCGGEQCVGPMKDARFCNDMCCPIHCQWDAWNNWSGCTKTCEAGSRHRERSVLVDAECSGEECRGEKREEEKCNMQCCPVDCALSEWSFWTVCSHTCGVEGTQTRHRNITIETSCGGKKCDSNLLEVRGCNKFCFNGGRLTPRTCACESGWKGDCCQEDIDECESVNCTTDSKCINSFGSFECACNHGYTNEGDQCIDVDECHHELHDCHTQAQCINLEGHYACKCTVGFAGNGTQCVDIDECAAELLGDESGYDPDYELFSNYSEYHGSSPLCHDDATCLNTFGGYKCKCNTGYVGNGVDCKDLDECKILEMTEKSISSPILGTRLSSSNDYRNITPCDIHATCFNTQGSYSCWCNDGYFGDGITCGEVNECDSNPCENGGSCDDKVNKFTCKCHRGFTGDRCEIDVDECLNTVPSEISGSGSGEIDPSEKLYNNVCHKNASCTNTFGSFECTCNAGFSGDGYTCFDIDECLTTENTEAFSGSGAGILSGEQEVFLISHFQPCSVHATCTNLVGNYSCQCKDGYQGDGFICSETNECLSNPCQNAGTCIDKVAEYQCLCGSGYAGANCNMDIDECELGTNNCDVDSQICQNQDGTFQCICRDGYTMKDGECKDVDECSDGRQVCVGFHEVCHNTPGGYNCGCTYPMIMKDGKCQEQVPDMNARSRSQPPEMPSQGEQSSIVQSLLKPAILASVILCFVVLIAAIILIAKIVHRRSRSESPPNPSGGKYRRKSLTTEEVTEDETLM